MSYILLPAKTNDLNVLHDGKGRIYSVTIVRRDIGTLCHKLHLGWGTGAVSHTFSGSIASPAASGRKRSRCLPPLLYFPSIFHEKKKNTVKNNNYNNNNYNDNDSNNNNKITFVIALTQEV